VASIERFAPCKDSLCWFCSHYVVFEVTIQFSIFCLFLVQAIWRKFEQGSSDIVTSFRWHPKYTLNLSLFQLCFSCFSFHVRLIFYFYFIFCLIFVILGKFQLFIYVCNGFRSLFANHGKEIIILTNKKS
jgi:hypothetical protein